jgi:hypothetical protein
MKKATKKAVKETTKKVVNEDALDFDPALVIRQYQRLTNIGQRVCERLNRELKLTHDRCFDCVDVFFGDRNSICICHSNTWMTIPKNIFVNGVDAIVDYVLKEHNKELEERRKAQEAENKVKLAMELEADKRQYLCLKEKLGIGDNKQSTVQVE